MATLALDVRVSTPGGGRTYIESLVPELVRQSTHRILLVRAAGDGLDLPQTETIVAPGPRVAQALWSQSTLAGLLRTMKVDLYHSLKHPGPVVFGGRTVCTLSAAGPYDGLCLYPLPVPDLLYWNVLGRTYLRHADHVIAVSAFVAGSLPPDLAPTADRLDIIPHGLPALFHAEPPPRNGTCGAVLAVGNMVAVKNFTTLVRAYAALPETLRARHPLVIAGDASGPEAERVLALAQAHGIRDRVLLTGYLGPRELREAFLQAEVFVVSSLQESFSFALLEAMACGLACAVTDCGGAMEVGGDTIVPLGDPRDVRGMRDGVAHLLLRPDERERLGALARRRSLSFTWEDTARRTLDVYDRVLARPPRERA